MKAFPILSVLILLPMLGGLFLVVANRLYPAFENRKFGKYGALGISVLTFFLSLVLWYQFDSTTDSMQFIEKHPWMPEYDISYSLGIDGISLYLILLTTFLIPICLLSGWTNISHNTCHYSCFWNL
jgi:NADH-quinone oxidoreductase subunit M